MRFEISGTAASDPTLSATATGRIEAALRGEGLFLDVGLVTVRVRGNAPALAAQIQRVYSQFAFRSGTDWADLHVSIDRVGGWRRVLGPQVVFAADGQQPFDPFPADTALPLLEWGANWLIGRRMNNVLLLHAGVLERDGLALVMPAVPGSGKSTLTCALSVRGWRLLSDEFGALDPATLSMRPVLKPAALKNQSIEVMRAFAPEAPLGPEFPKTRKGRVAHLAPSREAVAGVHTPAHPGAIVLPRWQAGVATQWEPVSPAEAFAELAFNAFNYNVLGQAGFRSVVRVVRQCPAWRLTYSDLDDALARIDAVWPEVVRASPGRSAAAAAQAATDL